MNENTLHIEQFVLQIPGLSHDEAQQLGQQVACYVVDHLPDRMQSLELGELRLKLQISEGIRGDRLARMIGNAIVEGLQ